MASYDEVVADSAEVSDYADFDFSIFLLEQIELADTLANIHAMQLLEDLAATSTHATRITANNTVSEALGVNELMRVAYEVLAADDTSFSDTSFAYARRLSIVADILTLSGLVDNRINAAGVVADTAVFQAVLERYFEAVVAEGVEMSGAIAALHRAVSEIIDQTSFDDLPAQAMRVTALISEDLAALDAYEITQQLNALITENLAFSAVLKIGGEEYYAWALNTQNLAPSQYTNYSFNSMAKFGTTYLGAKDDGIYELVGADDAGSDIDAVIKTGLLDFGSAKLKTVPECYLGYTATGRLVVKTITTTGGQKQQNWYELAATTADAAREGRIKIGRGLRARYWQFELVNMDGADFELDQLQMRPMILTRRV